MSNEYGRACTEVLTIINNMSIENYNKLPKELITELRKNMDVGYNFEIDYGKDLMNQNISDITKGILTNIYMDYWVNDEKKKNIEREFKQKRKIVEHNKKSKYNVDNMYKNTKYGGASTSLTVKNKKENLIMKIINKIKKFFGRK